MNNLYGKEVIQDIDSNYMNMEHRPLPIINRSDSNQIFPEDIPTND
jgi:hypothetical protein